MNILELKEKLEKSNDETLQYSVRESIRNQIQNELISNTEYVEWLYEFIKAEGRPVYEKWTLQTGEVFNEYNKTNIKMLYLFFDAIDKYAKSNFIQQLKTKNFICRYPVESYCINTLSYYNVRFNNFCFAIGEEITMGEDGDTLKDYCCISVKENQEEKYIDFNDILAYKKQENVDEIIENLEALSNLIKDVYKKGAPIEYIKSTLDRSLDELYSDENNKETHTILLKKL